jgi:hypothetical protein
MPAPFFLHRPDLDDFILVHTMAKVGSTAVVRSLRNVNVYCRHFHWASAETEAFFDRLGEVSPTGESQWTFYVHNRLNIRRLRSALEDAEYASLIKVITAIRAPVDQILSHYFQAMPGWVARMQQRDVEINAANVCRQIAAGVALFMARPERTMAELTAELDATNSEHIMFCWLVHNYLHWFDEEFCRYFPVDILGGRMNRGFQIAGNALILKFEDLSEHGERVLAGYAERPRLKLMRDNVGTQKDYGDLYRNVASTVKFPAAFVDLLCDSRYVRHFYSEDERNAMRRRWIG